MLDEALLLGLETQSQDSISNDIKHKLAFIGKLLPAQVASHHPSNHHLHHISERLSSMERDFHHWDSFRSLPCNDFDKDSSNCSCTDSCFNNDDETDLIAFEDPEKLVFDSNCEKAMMEYSDAVAEATGYVDEEKHTEETKNGFDKLASFDYEDAEDFLENFAGDKGLVEFDGALLRKTECKKENYLKTEESRHSTIGERCRALAAGVVIGMILMGFIMVNTFACFQFAEASYAVPT